MKDRNSDEKRYMKAKIHEGFYSGKNARFPTIIKEYENIEKIFIKLKYMACITVNIEDLTRIEYKYGSVTHNNLTARLMDLFYKLKQEKFRKEDIFVVDAFNPETFDGE